MIVCDIDGTAADVEHRRHLVPNWDAFFAEMDKDFPHKWCKELLWAMQFQGHEIHFVTGRPDNYREETEKWLGEHYPEIIPNLYMRAAGDHRPDHIVKGEIYDKNLWEHGPKGRHPTKILFVIDDRKQVVDMWRSKGLTVLQCAEGEF